MNVPVSHPTNQGFVRILLCVDASLASERAVNFTRQLAKSGATVCIAGVVEHPRNLVPLGPLSGFDLSSIHSELLDDTKAALAKAGNAFAGSDAAVETQLIDLMKQGGDVVHAIAGAAADWQADLLVLGGRQHCGLLRWVEGTVSEPVMQIAPCPMIVVPAHVDGEMSAPLERIAFAVDGSSTSMDALLAGARLASSEASIRVVYGVDRAVRYSDFVPITLLEDAFIKEGEATLSKAKDLLTRLGGLETVQVETALVNTGTSNDDIAHAIVRDAQRWSADLLVLGTHGRRGPARWVLGSVANRVARITTTPVMLVRETHT